MVTQTTTNTAKLDSRIAPATLMDALDAAVTLVDECKIHLNKDGIEIRAVDPANVGMVDLSLEKEAFEQYRAHGDIIGVNLERLMNVLGMLDKNEPATLEIQDNKLHVANNGLEFNISLIDPNSIRAEPDIPDINLPAEVTLEGNQITRGIRAADMVSDHIILGVDEQEKIFTVDAEGDTDDVHLELDEATLLSLTPGDANSIYSLDYLKDMDKAIPADAELTIELGEEFPAMMSYEKVYTDTDADIDATLSVVFMLAPRIQTE